jgi:hypothetical protein
MIDTHDHEFCTSIEGTAIIHILAEGNVSLEATSALYPFIFCRTHWYYYYYYYYYYSLRAGCW